LEGVRFVIDYGRFDILLHLKKQQAIVSVCKYATQTFKIIVQTFVLILHSFPEANLWKD